jgi:DNA-binding response OmpR family regulator
VSESRARLLVVEDDEEFARALARGLEAEAFDVTLAGDGADGLAVVHAGVFDAIVLDLMLPGVNGFRFAEILRAGGDGTPVLVLTAKQGDWDEAEALDAGADDYLRKPVSLPVLGAHLRALLRRHRGRHLPTATAGNLRLDLGSHRCWRSDCEIHLTPREFALLEFLFSRLGEPVAKREVLDAVWDWAIDDGSNLVEVYVGYLRRKIDTPFSRKALQTVWGVGYRLDPDGG